MLVGSEQTVLVPSGRILSAFRLDHSKAEEIEVKKVAKELLQTLKKEKLVLDWKKRQTTRAAVRYTVETVLDHLPRVYTPQIYEQKCEQVYQDVFDSYAGLSGGIYPVN
jgi:type I restriction enzyme, R subunit